MYNVWRQCRTRDNVGLGTMYGDNVGLGTMYGDNV